MATTTDIRNNWILGEDRKKMIGKCYITTFHRGKDSICQVVGLDPEREDCVEVEMLRTVNYPYGDLVEKIQIYNTTWLKLIETMEWDNVNN